MVDRPIGYHHGDIVYPINYGYIPGVIAEDGEEQDAYILGVEEPLAEFDGVVVAATYSGTMGNYVMINHGSGLYTIYMHASKLYVKKDDIVLRGNTIAAVGSTGRSTGPHLHFGVRKDGTYVSPWNYISKK